MVGPPIPFLQVQEMRYPWYQILSVAPECLAIELYPNVSDLSVLAQFLSALPIKNWLVECLSALVEY
jgi:hypothetical protein